MTHSHSHSSKETHPFKEGVQKLGKDVDDLKDNLGSLAQDSADAARAGIGEVKEGVKQAADTGKKKADAALTGISDKIAENPITSVGIALGVGILIGVILG